MSYKKNISVKGHFRNGTYIESHTRDYSIHENPYIISYETNPKNLDKEYLYLKNKLNKPLPFQKNIEYKDIDKSIELIIENHLEKLIEMKKTSKIHSDYINHLKDYIEDNFEDKLIKINNIMKYYKTFDEIFTIIYMIILSKYEPEFYYFQYIDLLNNQKNILNRNELKEEMKKIINEYKVELTNDKQRYDWEYRRNNFFELHIKPKINNPKIALHMLFKEICETELTK